MGTRIRSLGWYRPGLGTPLVFPAPPFRESNVIDHPLGPGPASLLRATVRWIVPSIPESLLGRGGVFGAEPASLGMGERRPRLAADSRHARDSREQETTRALKPTCGADIDAESSGSNQTDDTEGLLRSARKTDVDRSLS